MIKGVRRSKLAVESLAKYFGTVRLLVMHLKREADRKVVMELINGKGTLTDFIIGSAAVHLYHNLGLRIVELLDSDKMETEKVIGLETYEKRTFFSELKELGRESVRHELLIDKFITETSIFVVEKLLENGRDTGDPVLIEMLKERLDTFLMNILNSIPIYYLYDFLGEILELYPRFYDDIITESSALKVISGDIEELLVSEDKPAATPEISVLRRLMEYLPRKFEFDTPKQLKFEQYPMRKILMETVMLFLDKFPVSYRSLNMYKKAALLRKELLEMLEEFNNSWGSYVEFEEKILQKIKSALIEVFTEYDIPQIIYFLKFLIGVTTPELLDIFDSIGITEVPDFINGIKVDIDRLYKRLHLYGIQKMDVLRLRPSSPRNPINIFAGIVNRFKNEGKIPEDTDIESLITGKVGIPDELEKELKNKYNIDIDDLKKLLIKRKFIEQKIFPGFGINNYNVLIHIFDYREAFDRLVVEVFLVLLSSVVRHVCRLVEMYQILKDDCGLFTTAYEKISSVGQSDRWVAVKLEELIIDRIIKRQELTSIILDSPGDPFRVNGFILARMLNITLKDAVKRLKEEPSRIYGDIIELPLPRDIISPVSYPIAYDLMERYADHLELYKLRLERKQLKGEEKRKEAERVHLEAAVSNALNWIDRKITGGCMRARSGTVNPANLYWSEKDDKTCTENIVVYCRGGNYSERLVEFYKFALKRLNEYSESIKIPDDSSLKEQIFSLIDASVENRKSQQNRGNLMDGDLRNVAERLAVKIGKMFNKTIYKLSKKSKTSRFSGRK